AGCSRAPLPGGVVAVSRGGEAAAAPTAGKRGETPTRSMSRPRTSGSRDISGRLEIGLHHDGDREGHAGGPAAVEGVAVIVADVDLVGVVPVFAPGLGPGVDDQEGVAAV